MLDPDMDKSEGVAHKHTRIYFVYNHKFIKEEVVKMHQSKSGSTAEKLIIESNTYL